MSRPENKERTAEIERAKRCQEAEARIREVLRQHYEFMCDQCAWDWEEEDVKATYQKNLDALAEIIDAVKNDSSPTRTAQRVEKAVRSLETDHCKVHDRPRCQEGPGTTSDGRHCGAHGLGRCDFSPVPEEPVF